MTPRYHNHISRRQFLGAAGVLFGSSFVPRSAFALQKRDYRLICIVLRGALDGLSAVAPLGDPDYLKLREKIALQDSGENAALALDGFFFLHPAMPHLQRLFRRKEVAIFHA